MAQQKAIYEVEVDGQVYEIEADHEPTEAEVRASLAAMPKEGYWERNGEYIQQSAITPETRARLTKEKGWTWHPPPRSGGMANTGMGNTIATIGGFSLGPEELATGTSTVRGLAAVLRAGGPAALGRAVLPYATGEAARRGLEYMGAPEWVSIPAGVAAGGVTARGIPAGPMPRPPVGGRGTPSTRDISVPVRPSQLTQEELAARILTPTGTVLPRPIPTAPVVPAPIPPVAPVPAPPITVARPAVTGPAAWSPQRIQNELGLAARRAKVKLTDDQYQQAAALVREGHPPTAAVTRVAGPAAPPPVPKMKVTAAEVQAYQNYRRAGKTHEEAMALVELQRKLAASLGLPTSETVRQSVAGRNIAGEWTK